jgi:hypothetical protein
MALGQASNLKLRTLLSIADSLDFDVELKLIPREGGQALQAEL